MKKVLPLIIVLVIAWSFSHSSRAAVTNVYHERSLNATAFGCGVYAEPIDPQENETETIRFRVEGASTPQNPLQDELRVYFTTDGTNPAGALGVPAGTTQVIVAGYTCEGGGASIGTAAIPPQPRGTVVKYIIGVWNPQDNIEVFANGGGCTSSGCATIFMYTVGPRADTLGVYRPSESTFYLRNSNTLGNADIQVPYGIVNDIPVVGDWDGNGTTTIGVYRPSENTFYLRNSNTAGDADLIIPYGAPGDIPIVGDWNGDGITTIGIYRPSDNTFHLRNSNTTGFPDFLVQFGQAGDQPVVGDWDGSGSQTVGIYRPSTNQFLLKNENKTGPVDITITYGAAGDVGIAGDWNGDGRDTIGIYRPSDSSFHLRNSNTAGPAQLIIPYGAVGDLPVVGDWDAM
jgi:hypothetical protein